jgi:ribosome-binding ATPase YchF (GTP1/OBG family)
MRITGSPTTERLALAQGCLFSLHGCEDAKGTWYSAPSPMPFRFNVRCKPRYGSCSKGIRRIPIKLLDVAGLIPGASGGFLDEISSVETIVHVSFVCLALEGLGLGNKFLDDLRHADVLLHIIDASGTTNEKV